MVIIERMVSIVIVNWNSGFFLKRCLRSLSKNAEGAEIVVVDNASTDSSLNLAAASAPGVTIIRNGHNAGFAAGDHCALSGMSAIAHRGRPALPKLSLAQLSLPRASFSAPTIPGDGFWGCRAF